MRCRGLMFDRNRNRNAMGYPGMLLHNSTYRPGLDDNLEFTSTTALFPGIFNAVSAGGLC